MNRPVLLYWAHVAGLVGGVLILAGTLLMPFMMLMMGPMGMWASMMDGVDGTFGNWPGGWAGMAFFMVVWGALSGGVVLAAAARVRQAGPNLVPWGVAMIVAGVLSFPVMGGFWFGLLASLTGGILTILAESPAAGAPPTGPRAYGEGGT